MSKGIYSTSKIIQHPKAIKAMAEGRQLPAPVMVDFMPMLACNQNCSWCSYGHRLPGDDDDRQGWKNMELMTDEALPLEVMEKCLEQLDLMGVKALELTGGGEPLIYPHIDRFFALMASSRMKMGIVTNGTALNAEKAALIDKCRWRWVRISIDAGSRSDYATARRVPGSHWDRAWEAVSLMAMRRRLATRGQRVGVGFVVDRQNFSGVYEACKMAKEAGADNVRVTLAFSPHGADLMGQGAIDVADEQAKRAIKDLESEVFTVHNLIPERLQNLLKPYQDYEFCGMKEVRCVIGGDSNVYTCCSLAFNKKGLIGSLKDQSFEELWRGAHKRKMFACHRADKICDVECLYEHRNKNILSVLDGARAQHGEFV